MDLTLYILLLSFTGIILHVNYNIATLLYYNHYFSHVQLQYKQHNPSLILKLSCQHVVLEFETAVDKRMLITPPSYRKRVGSWSKTREMVQYSALL